LAYDQKAGPVFRDQRKRLVQGVPFSLTLPVPRRGGGGLITKRRVLAATAANPFAEPAPHVQWGRSEQTPTRFLQLTDERSGMNGLGTPGTGVAVAGERRGRVRG